MKINYVEGDATAPRGEGNKIIAHICNDAGRWGAGFVTSLSERFPSAEKEYRAWAENAPYGELPLGDVQFVDVSEKIWVANMIGQVSKRTRKNVSPIRYHAVEEALEAVSDRALELDGSVHMPRIGTGLGGGDWGRIVPILHETLIDAGIRTVVYSLPEQT